MKRIEVFPVIGEVLTRNGVKVKTLSGNIQNAINASIAATSDELVDSEIIGEGLNMLASGGSALVKLVYEVKTKETKKGGEK